MVRAKTQRRTHFGTAAYPTDPQNLINNNVAVIFPGFKKRQQKPRVKRVSWRDEQLQNMNVGDIDPAILVVREAQRIRYTKDQLLEIRKNPASKKKPEFLKAEVSSSILDSEKWNLERKKSDTPETSMKNSDPGDRRRAGDPRERIRKENDGIVLSPQRRSFNSGCFVPATKEPVRPARPHSPLGGKTDPPHIMGVREIQSSTRRIGSGRIMRDSWGDMGDKESTDNDYGFGRGQSRGNEREDKFGERRSFGREMDRDKEKDTRRNGRYSDRRKYDKEDEPEWFSSGPLSQNDTIELRGFDEPEKIKKRGGAGARMKRAKEWAKKKGENQPINEEKEKEELKEEKLSNQQDTDTAKVSNEEIPEKKTENSDEQNETSQKDKVQQPTEGVQSDNVFNFEEFFKCDNIQGLLTNGVSGDGNAATSRFSRWFKTETPTKDQEDSRRSSIQEDNHIIKDLLKDINESSSVPIAVHPPNDSSAYFAPISPAANTAASIGGLTGSKPPHIAMSHSVNIMEMLARVKQPTADGWKGPTPTGKILSLDELEAKIRPNGEHIKNQSQKPDEESAVAFKKLLQQASGHQVPQNGPIHKPQGMTLLEMLNHSQQQDEARLAQAVAATHQQHHLLSALHGPPQGHYANDLSVKYQKQQMDLMLQQSRELLNRPEAQAILQALHQRIPSPRELQVHTQNILQRALIKKKLEEQTENFRKKQEMQRGVSPNPVGVSQGGSKGVSSPTPLAFTPTSVLRKMTAEKDEGKENKAVGDNGVKPPGRPLTGMRPQPQVTVNNQWNSVFPVKQAGRPIVKANNTYASQTPEQLFNQVQQQRMYQTVPNQQQRKPIVGQQYPPQVTGSQYGSAPTQYLHPNPQSFSQPQAQLTAQQLRAQHQHRPSNNQPQKQGQSVSQGQQQSTNASWQQFFNSAAQQQVSGNRGQQQSGSLSPSTSDQLARWFSPDLLERARGGEFPSTADLSRHVLSLEEIERQAAPPVHN